MLYKLINPQSVSGYPYLAINKTRQISVCISDDHFTFESFYWETSRWLNCDYIQTPLQFRFDILEFTEFIENVFFEKDFTITAFTKDSYIERLVFTFNSSNTYYEIEYLYNQKYLKKITDDLVKKINSSEITDPDIQIFKEVSKRLKEFNNYKINLFTM